MNQTLINILKSREDISDYVFHFTKHADARKVLEQILADHAIKDIHNNGYICFSEAPITMLPDMFKIFEQYNDPMYAPYGIGIKKEDLFKIGGRPVIYSTYDEIQDFNNKFNTMSWRCVEYVPNVNDYSWLREWRVPSREVDLNAIPFIVVAKTSKEINELCYELDDIVVDGDVEEGCTEFLGYAEGKFKREYFGISFDDIIQANGMSKQELTQFLDSQHIGDEDDRYLGSIHNYI